MNWQVIASDKNHEIQFERSNEGYNYRVVGSNATIISEARVIDKQRSWHLDDIYTEPEYRGKGNGTQLLNRLCEHLSTIESRPISVHPAIGVQSFENLARQSQEPEQKYTPEELEQIHQKLYEDMKIPGFWETSAQNQTIIDSEPLKKWYKKNNFNNNPNDPSDRYLWRSPD
jgi:GNAT superfamily N-acetyltransferase